MPLRCLLDVKIQILNMMCWFLKGSHMILLVGVGNLDLQALELENEEKGPNDICYVMLFLNSKIELWMCQVE